MCVSFVAIHPKIKNFPFKVVFITNRDEDLQRPTSTLHWEEREETRSHILAGYDEKSETRGTWLGVNVQGRIGNVLSILQPDARLNFEAPTRGQIVTEYLRQSQENADHYLHGLSLKAGNFNGFNFIAIERDESSSEYTLRTLTNKFDENIKPVLWTSGCYGFGNSPPNFPFNKVSRGEKHFREFLEKFDYQSFSEGEFITGLLNLLSDETKCFPDTIICKQLEKLMSVEDDSYKFYCSLFVRNPEKNYGTRTQSVLLIRDSGVSGCDEIIFVEKAMLNTEGTHAKWSTTEKRFFTKQI